MLSREAKHPRATGAALLIAAVVLVALAYLKPNPFANPYEVRALFQDAGGLASIGAEVRIAGTTAGKVTSRERRGELALVTMELEVPEDTVRTDARAELRPRLLFEGTSYVDLEPGSPGARALGDSTLPAAQTGTAVSTADALGVLDEPTREAFQATVHELSAAAAPDAVNDALGDLPPVVRDAGTVVRAARGTGEDDLRRAVDGFARTARAVEVARDDLIPAAEGMRRTARGAAQPSLDGVLRDLPGTVADVETGAGAASELLDALDPLATELRPGVERLAPTLAAVRPVARDATPVLRATAPLVDDVRGAVESLARASDGTRGVLRATAPVLSTFENGLLDALERPTQLGTPSYLAFLGLFAGGGGASRPFIADQGHFMRFGFRFLTGAGRPVPPCSLLSSVSPQLAGAFAQAGGCQE